MIMVTKSTKGMCTISLLHDSNTFCYFSRQKLTSVFKHCLGSSLNKEGKNPEVAQVDSKHNKLFNSSLKENCSQSNFSSFVFNFTSV